MAYPNPYMQQSKNMNPYGQSGYWQPQNPYAQAPAPMMGPNTYGSSSMGATSSADSGTDWDSIYSGIGGIAGGALGLYNNPADEAMEYTEQVEETVSPYYDPWIEAGLGSLATLQQQFDMLVNDPYAVYAMLGENFEESPGYQWQYDQAMNASTNAAAAGGMAGGSYHQQEAANTAQNLAAQDYWNYMNYMGQLYKGGIKGQGAIAKGGYGASDALASILAQNLMNQARIAAMGSMQKNSAMGSLIGGTVDLLTSW